MSEEIKFDHFKDINELLEQIDLWYKEDDIEYTRWFGLEDLYNLKIYITYLQQKVEQLEKENKELKEENKRIFSKVNDDELLISNAMNYTEAQEYKLKYEQLENIRKEAKDFIKNMILYYNGKRLEDTKFEYIHIDIIDDLLNILNKGSEE